MFYPNCTPKTANRFADNFFQNFFPEENLAKYFQGSMPATNISETESAFLIEIAAPGLQKEDFGINIEQNLLTVKVEKAAQEEGKTFKRKEFEFSQFKRSFRLGKGIDNERISAQYEQGILRVELPKKEVTQEKTVRTVSVA